MDQTNIIHNFMSNTQTAAVLIMSTIAAILSIIAIISFNKKINIIQQKEKLNSNDKEKIFNNQLLRFLAIMLLMMNVCIILFITALI